MISEFGNYLFGIAEEKAIIKEAQENKKQIIKKEKTNQVKDTSILSKINPEKIFKGLQGKTEDDTTDKNGASVSGKLIDIGFKAAEQYLKKKESSNEDISEVITFKNDARDENEQKGKKAKNEIPTDMIIIGVLIAGVVIIALMD